MNEINTKEKIKIENMIYEIRGKQVMLDRDLARLYEVETRTINQKVKRNIERFPENFCFKLTATEWEILKSQFVISSSNDIESHGGDRHLPNAFTEQGVAMLSAVIKSDVAIKTSIQMMDAFVLMKKYISTNLLEQKYINNQVMKNTEDIKLLQDSFSKFEDKKKTNEIYFNGQIYDAYSKILDILKETKEELIIVDGYADKSLLDLIKNLSVQVVLIIKAKSLLTQTDINKYNSQYNNLKIIYDDTFHDRYFIIDQKEIYHCGASLNRIGTKTFSINVLEDEIIKQLLIERVNKLILYHKMNTY